MKAPQFYPVIQMWSFQMKVKGSKSEFKASKISYSATNNMAFVCMFFQLTFTIMQAYKHTNLRICCNAPLVSATCCIYALSQEL